MSRHGLIFLTGFSGSGKSTTGKLLSRYLKCAFVDLDSSIEKRFQMSVREIFSSKGEVYFRNIETLALESVCKKSSKATVVALGGGTLLRPMNRGLVRRSGVMVYLKCSQTEMYRRMHQMSDRPLLFEVRQSTQAKSAALKNCIRHLMSKRRVFYEQAHMTISTTDRTPREVARILYARLK